MVKLTNNIKYFRKRKGLTQIDLAFKFGVSRCCVSDWERDKRRPSIETILELMHFFHCSFCDLFYYTYVEDTRR